MRFGVKTRDMIPRRRVCSGGSSKRITPGGSFTGEIDSAGDTDLQVTLSEVRPDGKETYVQNGWLRASHRNGNAPRARLQPIPAGETVTAKVPLFPVAHAFRAGSRVRVTVEAPGGDRPRWRFDSVDDGSTRVALHLGRSKLTLPILRGVTAPRPLPAPTALRGQPSRAYVPASNGG